MTNPEQLLPAVVDLAREAGRRIMSIYATDFSVWRKDDRSPLTEADMAAHHTIIDGLERLTPDLPRLSEESTDIPFDERAAWRTYWLIDPLDGTREFVKRNGEFTVNIALIHDHEPVLGVVDVPDRGITYYAARGAGAYKQVDDAPPERIGVRAVDADLITVAGSRSHASESLAAFLENLGDYELITLGSSLKSCLVAEGGADIYPRFGPTSEWDTAAAQCVVEEAGGRLTDMQMRPMRYNTKESLLNPSFLVFGDRDHAWSRYLKPAEE